MSKNAGVLAALATLMISFAAPSFAGERRGDGGWTPIVGHIAAICAFSGLEDFDGGPVQPGVTQTPRGEGGNIFDAGVAAVCQFLNPGNNPKEPPTLPE